MTPKPRPDGSIKVAGRWWTPEQIFLFGKDWDDPQMTRRATCAKYGITWGTLCSSAWARRTLKIDGRARRHGGGPRQSISMPEVAHPFVKHVFRAAMAQERHLKDLCRDAFGECADGKTISGWKRSEPKLSNLEAVLNVLGYKLVIVPIDFDARGLASRAA